MISQGAVCVSVLVAACLAWPAGAAAAEPEEIRADVCVVGGGSAGIGAALGAARAQARVVLVERQGRLGGTSTNGYVCNWEPGPGGPIAREIRDRLARMPDGVGIVTDHNPARKLGPFGLWLITPGQTYEQTLRRSGRSRSQWRAMVYNPDALAKIAQDLLDETNSCRTLLKTTFTAAEIQKGRVTRIHARSEDGREIRIRAKVFVDCTGSAHLCHAAGCELMLGPDLKSRFGEPSAPEKAELVLNGIALCYRIRKSAKPLRQAPPETPVKRWPRSAHVSQIPGGDLIVNPLALLPGRTLIDVGYAKTMALAKPIAAAHWRWLQTYETFAGYEFHSFAPMLGIRESHRVLGEYVLTQQDVVGGLGKQKHTDLIALADHALDIHGAKGMLAEVRQPYGIPYRCLIPKGRLNLLVAGRCAGFSHIAASSCRLSRTMLALGRAAGQAAAMAAANDVPVAKVDVAKLKKQLGDPAGTP